MRLNEINIRDPFILCEENKYYLFGTRAKDFGIKTGGFDVYISDDLENWSEPVACYDSENDRLNSGANWAPEVWKYNNKFYMLATFTQENGLRGTFALVSENIIGPYKKCSECAITPQDWECLDGTLYIDKNNKPYLVFSHEHTQIIDGTICYAELKEDFSGTVGEIKELFSASSPYFIKKQPEGFHYITDGPYIYHTSKGELVMLWSTMADDNYLQCMAYSDNGEIDGNFIHIKPLYDKNGGHGMIFRKEKKLYLILHSPDTPHGDERPVLTEIDESEDGKGFIILTK